MAKDKELDLDLFVLCDYAMVAQGNNKLSIVGIFEQIFVPNVPSQQSKMSIVGVLKGEQSTHHFIELTIKDPLGKGILPSQRLEVTLGSNGRSNLIAEFNNLPLPLTGDYSVIISTSGNQLGVKQFRVIKTGGLNGRKAGPGDKLPN